MTSEGRTTESQESIDILVVGDFMIDQAWILSGMPSSTAQVHSNIKPMRRIHPEWKDKRLGGAGMTFMALKTIFKLDVPRNREIKIHGLGAWRKEDKKLIDQLAKETLQENEEPKVTVSVKRLKYRKNTATIIKNRFYSQLAEDQPQLKYRFDQDLYPPNKEDNSNTLEDDLTDPSAHIFRNIKAVLVADHNKGTITQELLEKVYEKLENNQEIIWFVDSKDPEIIKKTT